METRKIFYNFIIGWENSPCNGAHHFCENHQFMKKTLVRMPKSGETLQNIPPGDLTSRRKIGTFLREEVLSDNGSPESACGIWLSDMIERKNILDREGRGVFPVGPQAIPLFDGGRIAWAGIMIPAGCFTGCGRNEAGSLLTDSGTPGFFLIFRTVDGPGAWAGILACKGTIDAVRFIGQCKRSE